VPLTAIIIDMIIAEVADIADHNIQLQQRSSNLQLTSTAIGRKYYCLNYTFKVLYILIQSVYFGTRTIVKYTPVARAKWSTVKISYSS